jgi:hypothetical protein
MSLDAKAKTRLIGLSLLDVKVEKLWLSLSEAKRTWQESNHHPKKPLKK